MFTFLDCRREKVLDWMVTSITRIQFPLKLNSFVYFSLIKINTCALARIWHKFKYSWLLPQSERHIILP
jgi:hypothetical protein